MKVLVVRSLIFLLVSCLFSRCSRLESFKMEVLSPDTKTDALENYIGMEKHELAHKDIGQNTSVVFHIMAWAGGCTNHILKPNFKFDSDTLIVSFNFAEVDTPLKKDCDSENLIKVSYLIKGKVSKVYFIPPIK